MNENTANMKLLSIIKIPYIMYYKCFAFSFNPKALFLKFNLLTIADLILI